MLCLRTAHAVAQDLYPALGWRLQAFAGSAH